MCTVAKYRSRDRKTLAGGNNVSGELRSEFNSVHRAGEWGERGDWLPRRRRREELVSKVAALWREPIALPDPGVFLFVFCALLHVGQPAATCQDNNPLCSVGPSCVCTTCMCARECVYVRARALINAVCSSEHTRNDVHSHNFSFNLSSPLLAQVFPREAETRNLILRLKREDISRASRENAFLALGRLRPEIPIAGQLPLLPSGRSRQIGSLLIPPSFSTVQWKWNTEKPSNQQNFPTARQHRRKSC